MLIQDLIYRTKMLDKMLKINSIVIILLIFMQNNIFCQDSTKLSVNTSLHKDSIKFTITVFNKSDTDTILIPISFWHVLVPKYSNNLVYPNHDSYGGYNMISIYQSKNGKKHFHPLTPFCKFPTYFPLLLGIVPRDSLRIIFETRTRKLNKRQIANELYALLKINYVVLRDLKSNEKISQYLNKYPELMTLMSVYHLDINSMEFVERNLINYRNTLKSQLIDNDFRDLLCNYFKNYLETNFRISKH